MHCSVETVKSPPVLRRVERLPPTTSYLLAPSSALHDSAPSGAALLTESTKPLPGVVGISWHQLVLAVDSIGPVEEKVIQPTFSPQARPRKYPVAVSIVTPHVGSGLHVVGLKLIQP